MKMINLEKIFIVAALLCTPLTGVKRSGANAARAFQPAPTRSSACPDLS